MKILSQAPTEPAVISTRPSKRPTFPLDGWLPEPRRAVLWIILASTLLHLGLALYLPLASHEAHYASYGFRLDYGYVDHPPLVGWLQALPVLIVFFIAGGYTRGRIHWTFVGWTLLAPLAAHWLIINWKHRAARILTVSSGVFSLLAMIVVVGLTAPAWRFPDHAHPYGELYGWREATARGVQLLTDLRRQPGTEQAEFFVLDFHDAEKLAWYARPLPAVVISPKTSQYPIWFGDAAPGDPGILVIPEYKSGGPDQPPAAYGCAFLEEYVHYHGETLTASFRYYRCGV